MMDAKRPTPRHIITKKPTVKEKEKLLKAREKALAGVAQWTERGPVNQRVTSSIPSQGTCLGCSQDWGRRLGEQARGNHTLMFLSLPPSLPLSLKINKIF